jgi:hypothetical protein
MDSGSLSEDLEMDKESTAHVDDFKGALKTLLEKSFVSLEDALKGLELFKLQGYSPLAKNADLTNKTTAKDSSVQVSWLFFQNALAPSIRRAKGFLVHVGPEGREGALWTRAQEADAGNQSAA